MTWMVKVGRIIFDRSQFDFYLTGPLWGLVETRQGHPGSPRGLLYASPGVLERYGDTR